MSRDPRSQGDSAELSDANAVAEAIDASAGADPAAASVTAESTAAVPIPWWHCRRRGPVSGRYEGEMTAPNAGRYVLDLRVDIDPRHANSPVLRRVSADVYQLYRFTWWGGRSFRWRVYRESWIVDAPAVRWWQCSVRITGTVRYWSGWHPKTTVEVVIPWTTFGPAGPADVTLRTLQGAVGRYSCARKSDCFRSLNLEIDIAQSVNQPPIVPRYDTHWHPTRPANTPQRMLTIEEAYREAGVCVTVRPQHTIIDDSNAQFQSWSVAELHDAMEHHFSQIGGVWPKWEMWGLLAGQFDNPGVGGIMFDAAAQYGGAGEPPERQGFAVFRSHTWFDDLRDQGPANDDQAAAIRKFLYTWVHEAGHAFNFLHSWNKNRPDALSWMNYDWRYDNRNGADSFWSDFEFEFDTEELLHMRHGDRPAVIMGGDPWASGGHLEAPGAMEMTDGEAPLEVLVRGPAYFEFMEPVVLELRLRNLLPDLPLDVDTRLDPSFGSVVMHIMRPDGRVVRYEPVFCQLGETERVRLEPAGAPKGEERFSDEVTVDFGKFGHYFTEPGTYRLRALYHGLGDTLIPSNVHTIRVGTPRSPEDERFAGDYFSYQAGMAMCLGGSRSDRLAKGLKTLEELLRQRGGSVAAARVASAIAQGYARPFFKIDRLKLKEAGKADVDQALDLTAGALAVFTKERDLNIGYHHLVRRRAKLLVEAGRKSDAKKEVDTLHKDLKARKVNPPVLTSIRDFGDSL